MRINHFETIHKIEALKKDLELQTRIETSLCRIYNK